MLTYHHAFEYPKWPGEGNRVRCLNDRLLCLCSPTSCLTVAYPASFRLISSIPFLEHYLLLRSSIRPAGNPTAFLLQFSAKPPKFYSPISRGTSSFTPNSSRIPHTNDTPFENPSCLRHSPLVLPLQRQETLPSRGATVVTPAAEIGM